MSDKSAIEWTDATWNPTTGCTKVSPACANCYIERTPPFRIRGRKFVKGDIPLELHENRLDAPLRRKVPTTYFVNSLSDLFHEDIPNEFIAAVFGVMAATPRHTYQLLTKRPARMREWYRWIGDQDPEPWSHCHWEALMRDTDRQAIHRNSGGEPARPWPLPNVWIGVSVENQHFADERIPLLLQTPAAVRFISAEPLLESIDIGMSTATCPCCRRWPSRWVSVHREVRPEWPVCLMESARGVVASPGIHRAESNPHGALSVGGMGLVPDDFEVLPRLDWVIVGGESGPRLRPTDPAWIRSLRDQCVAAGVPFFFKQWGGKTAKSGGRLLDGREWNEMPQGVR